MPWRYRGANEIAATAPAAAAAPAAAVAAAASAALGLACGEGVPRVQRPSVVGRMGAAAAAQRGLEVCDASLVGPALGRQLAGQVLRRPGRRALVRGPARQLLLQGAHRDPQGQLPGPRVQGGHVRGREAEARVAPAGEGPAGRAAAWDAAARDAAAWDAPAWDAPRWEGRPTSGNAPSRIWGPSRHAAAAWRWWPTSGYAASGHASARDAPTQFRWGAWDASTWCAAHYTSTHAVQHPMLSRLTDCVPFACCPQECRRRVSVGRRACHPLKWDDFVFAIRSCFCHACTFPFARMLY